MKVAAVGEDWAGLRLLLRRERRREAHGLRESLGISYFTVFGEDPRTQRDLMQDFAPVVERLAGT